jgi:hypothetical protein
MCVRLGSGREGFGGRATYTHIHVHARVKTHDNVVDAHNRVHALVVKRPIQTITLRDSLTSPNSFYSLQTTSPAAQGAPVFHDGSKKWGCCGAKSHDFATFMAGAVHVDSP